MTGAAGFIVDDRGEMLAANHLGRALAAPMITPGRRVNVARYVFLDPGAPGFFAESWPEAASMASSTLRTALGRYPGDSRLTALIGQLTRGSAHFRRYWEMHDVALPISARRRYQHPAVGRIELDLERLALPQDPRLALLTLGAPPGSRSATALTVLREIAAPCLPDAEDVPDG